ncbi:Nitroreductase family [Carpediemonas membranifera]|uniref:Nitroreductase family n=1 Tax=Carpediemonas membranifera TaxID=201153 RepID=A0A8J6AXK9_9EUKA|nr:Nitroreductase family [Carpediemonas membranifera]|eukprot:KAG9394985.1 Nitroreductase family [Carpediemonas membranifera]
MEENFITDSKGRRSRTSSRAERMDLKAIVSSRRCCREFTSQAVLNEQLDRMLDMTRYAPTAGGLQSFDVVVVHREQRIASLADACKQPFVKGANVVLVFCANNDRAAKYGEKGPNYAVQDTTLAACYAMLAAEDEGLSTVWVGAFDPKEVANIIGAPSGVIPEVIMPVGFPTEAEEARKTGPGHRTKDLDELVHDEQYGERILHHEPLAH